VEQIPQRQHRLSNRVAAGVILCCAAFVSLGWSGVTVRHVAWRAVQFFPPDLARQVYRHHDRFEAGLQRGLTAPPAWRAGPPGVLEAALESQALSCRRALREPVALADLVEQLGVLAVCTLDANDPLAVAHSDPREPLYATAYLSYTDAVRNRIKLVYYGADAELVFGNQLHRSIATTLARTRELYGYVGQEFYRTGVLRDWRSFDDRSVAFGVAAICLSRGMTDLANFAAWVWKGGGGFVPTPTPTPQDNTQQTLTIALRGGFPDNKKPTGGRPALPPSMLQLPPP